MPARPGMPQIVPPEIHDPSRLESRLPRLAIHLRYRLAVVNEHVLAVIVLALFLQLLTQNDDSCSRERHSNRLPRLGLVRVNPCFPSHQVNLRPPQPSYVGL